MPQLTSVNVANWYQPWVEFPSQVHKFSRSGPSRAGSPSLPSSLLQDFRWMVPPGLVCETTNPGWSSIRGMTT